MNNIRISFGAVSLETNNVQLAKHALDLIAALDTGTSAVAEAVAPAVAPSAPTPRPVTAPARQGRTVPRRAPVVVPEERRSKGASDDQIVAAVRAAGSIAPGALAKKVGIVRESLRPRVAALIARGVLAASGTTISKRISLAQKSGPVAVRETKAPVAETNARLAETPVDATSFAQAVDGAVQARLRQGRATLEQLESALPKDLVASLRRHGQDVTATLKKSLRRLTLRREIADVGAYFTRLEAAS